MSVFQGILNNIINTRSSGYHGIPFMFDSRLDKYITGIKQSKYYGIAGRASSGKRSFTDLHFIFNTFAWWASFPEDKRPKVKVLYFNMDKTEETKIQKWICTYMYIYHQKLIDIPTLMNWPGKLYDLDEETLAQISAAKGFFDLMFEQDFVTMYNGRVNPTGIKANVSEYFKGIGGINTEDHVSTFEYDEGYENQITLIVIDNTRKLKVESQKGHYYNERELNQKLSSYLLEMKEIYKATPVVIIPTEDIGGHDGKAPSIKEFGNYYNDIDVALYLSNPGRYHSKSGYYGDYNLADFRDNAGMNRLRICSILRNAEGRDSTWVPMTFIPENGYIFQTPNADDPSYFGHIDFIKQLKQ